MTAGPRAFSHMTEEHSIFPLGTVLYQGGALPLRIFEQSVGGNMSKVMIFIAIVGQFFCGMASVTANSRMIYAFSRDGALPG